MKPREHLDLALRLTPGEERVLSFTSRHVALRYLWKLQGVKGQEVKESKRAFDPDDPAWGTHPWANITIARVGDTLVLRWDDEPTVETRKGEGT